MLHYFYVPYKITLLPLRTTFDYANGSFKRCLFWCIATCICACGIASCKLQELRESCHLPLRVYMDKSKAHATVTKRLFVAAIFIQDNSLTCITFIIKPIARDTRGFAYPCDFPYVTNHNIQYLYPATVVFG